MCFNVHFIRIQHFPLSSSTRTKCAYHTNSFKYSRYIIVTSRYTHNSHSIEYSICYSITCSIIDLCRMHIPLTSTTIRVIHLQNRILSHIHLLRLYYPIGHIRIVLHSNVIHWEDTHQIRMVVLPLRRRE